MTFTATRRARLIEAELQHPPATAAAAEMEQLRAQARMLFRRYGRAAYRMGELLRLEARQRQLRGKMRAALGQADVTDTRGRSLATRGISGISRTGFSVTE